MAKVETDAGLPGLVADNDMTSPPPAPPVVNVEKPNPPAEGDVEAPTSKSTPPAEGDAEDPTRASTRESVGSGTKQNWSRLRTAAKVTGKLAIANKEIQEKNTMERRKLDRALHSSQTMLADLESKMALQKEEPEPEDEKKKFRLYASTGGVMFLSLLCVVILCVWAKNGMMGEEHIGHSVTVKSRVGHMHSPMYITPANIALTGTMKQFFEIRLIGMATKDFSKFDSHHRRLDAVSSPEESIDRKLGVQATTGSLTYKLYADGQEIFEKTVSLCGKREVEDFETVDVGELGFNTAKEFSLEVNSTMPDGREAAFLCQVLQMGNGGRWREVIGAVIFVITFVGIVTEIIHRSYCAFLGAGAALCALSAIQETPHLHHIALMIDWGTLMLLFSMMILMSMLAETGFFNWFAARVVIASRQNVTILWFMLCNISGFLSMLLDNVTCVLLFGPLVFNLAKKMKINPRPLYLAMTICATVGGTATQIGDPPNIVIGSKLKLGFEEFLIWNLPITALGTLPLSSYILWRRLKKNVFIDGKPALTLDLKTLSNENRITNMSNFLKLMAVLFGILIALLSSPIHKIEPAWFCVMGMFGCAIMFERHHLDKYLDVVEWGTLLFFALLFVLVETLSELGVIRMLGKGVISLIEAFPEDARMAMAIIIMLWVSALGSAFLESLPFTTTIVYVLIDLQTSSIKGVRTNSLIWPLSMGACMGGIGSIMGSSANLVSMAVSNRFGEDPEQRIQGGDFLKNGLPTLLIITCIGMVWLLVLFVGLELGPEESAANC